MKSRFMDNVARAQRSASTGGSEKAPGAPKAGGGSSSGAGFTVKQVEKLPTTGSGIRTPMVDSIR